MLRLLTTSSYSVSILPTPSGEVLAHSLPKASDSVIHITWTVMNLEVLNYTQHLDPTTRTEIEHFFQPHAQKLHTSWHLETSLNLVASWVGLSPISPDSWTFGRRLYSVMLEHVGLYFHNLQIETFDLLAIYLWGGLVARRQALNISYFGLSVNTISSLHFELPTSRAIVPYLTTSSTTLPVYILARKLVQQWFWTWQN